MVERQNLRENGDQDASADSRPESRRIFAGPRIRRMRLDLGLTQARMAEELGISTSYMNLIERNQRPLTAQVLIRLAEAYEVDLTLLGGDEEAQAAQALSEIFADPAVAVDIPAHEINDLAAASPMAVQALDRLYRAYQDATQSATVLAEQLSDREDAPLSSGVRFPVEEVRDIFHDRRNHFTGIDDAAEDLARRIGLGAEDAYVALRSWLDREHGLKVRIAPTDLMSQSLRRYDYHRRTVFLSERLSHTARAFQLAYQIAQLNLTKEVADEVEASPLKDDIARDLMWVALSNYAAAAILMPYDAFLKAANALRYDVEALGDRFSAGFEQVAHRLTTLNRAGAKGIPFFLMRVDGAGNVSKRFAAGGFHFARSGGTCPRWNVHDSFRVPGQIFTQIIQLPDMTTYFSIARTVKRMGGDPKLPNQQLAVCLGCEISYAQRICYADRHNLYDPAQATPIGVNCRLCDRPDCTQRAFPPLSKPLVVNPDVRGVSSFTFKLD